MSQLIESIKILDNQIYRFTYHKKRMSRSCAEIYDTSMPFDFSQILNEIPLLEKGLFKLRLLYDDKELEHEFIPYQMKNIESLKIVESDTINYAHKFSDRSELNDLYDKKKNADDILIVKNGKLTDTFHCNISLHKDGVWYTPVSPLLKGTQRQYLIDQNLIVTKNISIDTLLEYDEICLFNAMIEFGQITFTTDQIS